MLRSPSGLCGSCAYMRSELHSYLSAGWDTDVQADAILKPSTLAGCLSSQHYLFYLH